MLLGSAYIGLNANVVAAVNDKVLHFLDFFLLTVRLFRLIYACLQEPGYTLSRPLTPTQLTLYWSFDLPRRLCIKIVLTSMLVLSVASEFLQAALPNGRQFDPIDIVANVVGTTLALTLCGWYHRRMLERRRQRKLQGYGVVPGGEAGEDVELAEGGGSGQEMGVTAEDDDTGEAWDDIGGIEEPEEDSAKVNGAQKGGGERPE